MIKTFFYNLSTYNKEHIIYEPTFDLVHYNHTSWRLSPFFRKTNSTGNIIQIPNYSLCRKESFHVYKNTYGNYTLTIRPTTIQMVNAEGLSIDEINALIKFNIEYIENVYVELSIVAENEIIENVIASL